MSIPTAQLAGRSLRVTTYPLGEANPKLFYQSSILLGRAAGGKEAPDLDFNSDPKVSRRHARISVDGLHCHIQDLNSRFGTWVDGVDIRGKSKVLINGASRIRVGESEVKIEGPLENTSGFAELEAQSGSTTTFEIDRRITGSAGDSSTALVNKPRSMERQALVAETAARLSHSACLDDLLQTIITEMVKIVPEAKRGALLLKNPATNGILVAAFVSSGEPSVSETLARQALARNEAFVWRNRYGSDPSLSIQRHGIESGLYAPLSYNDRPFGVLCVDSPDSNFAFQDDDIYLLLAVAYHATAAIRTAIGNDASPQPNLSRDGFARSDKHPGSLGLLRRNCLRAIMLLSHLPARSA